jgi:hypothetical protein
MPTGHRQPRVSSMTLQASHLTQHTTPAPIKQAHTIYCRSPPPMPSPSQVLAVSKQLRMWSCEEAGGTTSYHDLMCQDTDVAAAVKLLTASLEGMREAAAEHLRECWCGGVCCCGCWFGGCWLGGCLLVVGAGVLNACLMLGVCGGGCACSECAGVLQGCVATGLRYPSQLATLGCNRHGTLLCILFLLPPSPTLSPFDPPFLPPLAFHPPPATRHPCRLLPPLPLPAGRQPGSRVCRLCRLPAQSGGLRGAAETHLGGRTGAASAEAG